MLFTDKNDLIIFTFITDYSVRKLQIENHKNFI